MNDEKKAVIMEELNVVESMSFDPSELPIIITGQIEKLNELDLSVKKALMKADEAKKSAEVAKDRSAGFGKKKAAIEELQSSGVDLADAVQSGAEAQKISFEFQTKLAQITKYLFGLGVSNIANNRFVVREIEMRMKGASDKEISDLAKKELISVVKQLKDQEDLLKKQENITKIVKGHDQINKVQAEQIKLQEEMDKMLEEKIQDQDEVDKAHAEQIKLQEEMDKMLEEKIQDQDEVDKAHTEQIKLQEEMDKVLEKKIQAQDEVDKAHAEQIKLQAETYKKHEELINKLQKEVKGLKTDLELKGSSTLLKIAVGIGSLGVVLSIVSLAM